MKVRFTAAQGGGTQSFPLEQYLAAVLAGEASVFKSDEALKAMAVAARTYAMRLRGRHQSEGYDFCATTHCQSIDPRGTTRRLESIAGQTAGELLWFEAKPAFACYTRDCGGASEDAGAAWPDMSAPYLKSHPDPYCVRGGGFPWHWSASLTEIADALRQSGLKAPRRIDQIAISGRTGSGRARVLLLGGDDESVSISASSFRFAVGRGLGWNTLRSDRYEARISNGRSVFQGTGAGHGVGLCQHGADQMGQEGHTYREILAFYYPGTKLGLTARGLEWVKLAGESVTVLTTTPDRDSSVLAIADRFSRDLKRRARLPFPQSIEIRIYPDVETFRNVTGEPGWVAAHTIGSRIHLQPTTVLRDRGALEETLRHELMHVMVESHARPGLPVWFREGLVGYFSGPPARPAAAIPHDADLRQTGDFSRARRGYEDATRKVTALAGRYGESTLLGWLARGLPPEVTNASTSQAPTKSK
jgi:stage II sporulation protein D